MNSSGLECPLEQMGYTRLCEYLDLDGYKSPKILPFYNVVANINKRIKIKFNSDIHMIATNLLEIQVERDKTKTFLGIYCGLRVKNSSGYNDFFNFQLKNIKNKKDIERYPYWPTNEDFKRIAKGKEEEARYLRGNIKYAIFYGYVPWFPLYHAK